MLLLSSLLLLVAGVTLTAVAGVPGVVDIHDDGFVPDVAGVPSVACVPAVAGNLAAASAPANPVSLFYVVYFTFCTVQYD
jgi:hypothetical protein